LKIEEFYRKVCKLGIIIIIVIASVALFKNQHIRSCAVLCLHCLGVSAWSNCGPNWYICTCCVWMFELWIMRCRNFLLEKMRIWLKNLNEIWLKI